MHGYWIQGWLAAVGISSILAIVFYVIAFSTENLGQLGTWVSMTTAMPFIVSITVARSMAKAKVNVKILNPKGMNLQDGCFVYRIMPFTVPGTLSINVGALEEQPAIRVEHEEKSRRYSVGGKRERERAPANFGTVELSHSSNDDVVRSLYAHISAGATRSERIITCNIKIVYVPEEDLSELAQVYNSKQMGELRMNSKSEDGARRVLRFFYSNGCSLAAGSDRAQS